MGKIETEQVEICDCPDCVARRKAGKTLKAETLMITPALMVKVRVPAGTLAVEVEASMEMLGRMLAAAVEAWEEDYAPGKVRH